MILTKGIWEEKVQEAICEGEMSVRIISLCEIICKRNPRPTWESRRVLVRPEQNGFQFLSSISWVG
jgi:hypothetical protein